MIRRGEQSFARLGRGYEEAVQLLFLSIGIDARLVGGRSDGGVDLQGRWRLAPERSIPIIAQCKLIEKKCPPSFVRELEGTVARLSDTLAMLVSSSDASSEALTAIRCSPYPLLFLHYSVEQPTLKAAFLNDSLLKRHPGLHIAHRHSQFRDPIPVFTYNHALIKPI